MEVKKIKNKSRGLKQHKGVLVMTEFSFFKTLALIVAYSL